MFVMPVVCDACMNVMRCISTAQDRWFSLLKFWALVPSGVVGAKPFAFLLLFFVFVACSVLPAMVPRRFPKVSQGFS